MRPGGGTVYARDLKSLALKACGFESHPGYKQTPYMSLRLNVKVCPRRDSNPQ